LDLYKNCKPIIFPLNNDINDPYSQLNDAY
jgi:hypothetical protein